MLDRFGGTQVLLRDHYAGLPFERTATDKAWTAIGFRSHTSELAKSIKKWKARSWFGEFATRHHEARLRLKPETHFLEPSECRVRRVVTKTKNARVLASMLFVTGWISRITQEKMMRLIFATATLFTFVSYAHADGDPAKGEQAFRVCMACHAVGPGAKTKVGPELNGVVGRKWALIDGYSYSTDLADGKAQGKVWDEATLDDYLTNPKHLAPHGKMGFTGISQPDKRADVISYLKQFDADGNKK